MTRPRQGSGVPCTSEPGSGESLLVATGGLAARGPALGDAPVTDEAGLIALARTIDRIREEVLTHV